MKTIGLLGGTGWSSTIDYYKLLNELVHQRLGGYHSAKVLLKSVDYHEIMSNYGLDNGRVATSLQQELEDLIKLKPDCLMICCNSLHKFYDSFKTKIKSNIPLFHAIELVAEHAVKNKYHHVLLLATQFTMEDGFFARTLEQRGIKVTIPDEITRIKMQTIHSKLMNNNPSQYARDYFAEVICSYDHLDAVVLGCTEFPMVVDTTNSVLPIINPITLQAEAAVDFALKD